MMTPRSSGPGGEYTPLRGTTNLRLTANQHCNVTENCAGVLAGVTSLASRLRGSATDAWVTFEKRPWVTSRERRSASDDAMFFADTGTAVIWLARHIKGSKNRRLFGSFAWASMANAAPNAFGAQLAFPGRQTIAMCGDGGFTMLGLGDLLT